METDAQRIRCRFLILLLSVDTIYLLLHILHVFTPWLPSKGFSVKMDLGYAEMFQYAKEFWVVLLLLIITLSRMRVLYLCWAILFLYILVDDCLFIHERLSPHMVELLNIHGICGLRAQDCGEFVVHAIFGIPFLVVIVVVHMLSDKTTRKVSKSLFIMLVFMALFGVGIDILPCSVKHDFAVLSPIIGMLEDGGEMVVMSVICGFLFTLSVNGGYSDNKVHVTCPKCGRILRGATIDMIDQTGVCPKCKAEFVIQPQSEQT